MNQVSDKYEGLNLPQLLDLMHGIVVPDPVPWTPQTSGWWVLLGWLVAVVALSALKYVQYRRRNRYRREALDVLDDIDKHAADDPVGSAAAIAALVKRTALAVWPRERVASLHGDEWAAFLVESAGNDSRVAGAAPKIARAAYDPRSSGSELVKPARRWIKVHRA